MSDIKLTDELKRMNGYYRLLSGLVAESMGVLNRAGLAPEARLELLREKLEFVQRYTRDMPLPPSVRAELTADVTVQAVLADIARRLDPASDTGGATYLVRDDDGEFHEVVDGPDSGMRPLSDEEVRAILWENDAV